MDLSNPDSNTWTSWLRVFDIPDVRKHNNGFTVYKVISLLYPESCPDSVTKITVWKRFNDFKKLHQEIKVLHKKLNYKDNVPSLPKSVLFKRFDEETVNQRKIGILNFLDYIGSHSMLFTSTVFVKFFETSHTPSELLNGNINLIRANLNLPEDKDPSINSDDDRTISDSDSFTSSNLGSLAQAVDLKSDSISKASISSLNKLNSMTSIDSHSSKASESCSISNVDCSLLLLDGQVYPTPPTTPCSAAFNDNVQYLVNASIHVNLAIELENDRQYEEAFTAYKAAIDILINGGKDENDFERKQMVIYKTEKYLIRAEKIYNMYLAPEIRDLHLQRQQAILKPNIVKGPLFNLYKYKVIKIISSGMLVLHSELQQLFYIKVIHKTVQFLNDHLILPENVPYMVKLINHYNCENALFLVLEYCSGAKLSDFLKNLPSGALSHIDEELLIQIQEQSDNESELSFSELLNEYTSNRQKALFSRDNLADVQNKEIDSDDSFEKVDIMDLSPKKNIACILDQPLEKVIVPDLFDLSKKFDISTQSKDQEENFKKERKTSELSSFELEDEFEPKNSISEQKVVKWAAQLLVAIEKLHSLGVICRDLRIENLLLDEKEDLILTYMCNIKDICDLYSKGINLNLAPEVYSFEEVTQAVDWWSFGAILYELLVGMPLSEIHSNGITSYTHLRIPKYVSAEGKSLLKQLLIYEPHDRLGSGLNGTEHVKSHPFFRTVSWTFLDSKIK